MLKMISTGVSSTDIDECSTGLDDCSLLSQRCINTLGGYLCIPRRRCSAGYATDPVTGTCQGTVNEEEVQFCFYLPSPFSRRQIIWNKEIC